jgi:hypothetical protein
MWFRRKTSEALEAAVKEREAAEHRLSEARVVIKELHVIRQHNHFAESIPGYMAATEETRRDNDRSTHTVSARSV